jgi:HEAT repeat protein
MFEKGKSGNPGGRAKADPRVLAALKAATPKAVKVLIALLDSDDEDIRFKAASNLIDRECGKPAQSVIDPNGNIVPCSVLILPARQ